MLRRRNAAKQALLQAETDRKLRRAMLRKYQGTNLPLEVGQLCFFWRDARAADLVKIRWHGPARVVAREDKDRQPDVYWLAWKTQLLRCSPHHVRADFTTANNQVVDAKVAIKEVQSLKSRGVTRYLDLDRVNKQNIFDLEDEEMGTESDPEVMEPPLRRRRLDHVEIPLRLPPSDEPLLPPLPDEMPPDVTPTPTSPMSAIPENAEPPDADLPGIEDESPEELAEPPSLQPDRLQQTAHVPPGALTEDQEPGGEPPHPPTPATGPVGQPAFQLDPATAALYEPATDESFQQMRRRFDHQETAIFGPMRRHRAQSAAPYAPGPPPHLPPGPEDAENVNDAFTVQDVQADSLPTGWIMDEEGYLQLDMTTPKDFWELRAGCLIRHHVLPRRRLHAAQGHSDCPVPFDCLDPVRVTMMKMPDGHIKVATDNGEPCNRLSNEAWTGVTVYQLNGPTRKEYGMFANLPAKKVARQQKNMIKKKKPDVSERHLSLHEKELFMQAKVKELKSFFENGVWEFQTTREADPTCTLTSRILLKWSRSNDGTPRAKARLIVRGYADKDALEGHLATAAPSTSRLSRSYFFSTASTLGWSGWTADVQTAFLQGQAQERELWLRLPAEALAILGAPPDTRMKLIKPVYGQLDAPRKSGG